MNTRAIVPALLLALGLGCGGGSESRLEPKPEPDHVLVAHVLISFAGVPRVQATRSKAEAEKLANEVLARVRKGEDINKLMKDLSNDPGEGVYPMVNRGAQKNHPDEIPRGDMVQSFGDVSFRLEVGEVGMAAYDPVKSKFGWHIIKRLK